MAKSLVELAYDYVSSNKGSEITFRQIWNYVVKESGLNKEEANNKIGRFYTSLMLDGRFVILEGGIWDLTSNQTYDTSHKNVNMKDFYATEDTTESDDAEESQEEIEYNEAFMDTTSNENESGEDGDNEPLPSEEDELA